MQDITMHPAEQFLKVLDPSADKFLFLTFDDVANRKDNNYVYTRWGTFAEFREFFTDLNNNGAGIYVTVNKTEGNRRRLSDVVTARAIWQESDNDTTDPNAAAVAGLGLEPQIVVQSSEGKYHRYWLTSQEDRHTWERAQSVMVKQYGSDPGAKDYARVLRLPGFYNHKYNPAPMVRLEHVAEGAAAQPYPWEVVESALCGKNDTCDPTAPLDSKAQSEPESAGNGQLALWAQQIAAGEHLHTPIRGIMMLNANKGIDRAFSKLMLTGLIQSCPDESRKQKALADLDAMLTATYRKISEEQSDDDAERADISSIILSPRESTAKEESSIEYPPGLMGELCEAANDFFVIPNKTAAIMTAFSLIAGITGRRYNVSNGGLNLYTTIMMPTGAGKDSLRKFCHRVLADRSMFGTNGTSFMGSQNFTGPKALLDELQVQPSMLCVMTEAGLLYRTDSGDKNGLTRIILQAYTSSGEHDVIEAERYSSNQDSIAMLRAPALTILNEATPITLLGELKKRESINTGELPRMWIFNLVGKKPYNNPDPHQLRLSPACTKRIRDLLADCYTVQNQEPPKVVHIPMPDGNDNSESFKEYSDWCTDQYNEHIIEDPNRAVIYSRSAHKVLKIAAITALFNAHTVTGKGLYCGPPSAQQLMPNLEWGKKLFEYEMANISSIIDADTPINAATHAAMDIIVRLSRNEYGGQATRQPKKLRGKNMFTESMFKQASANRPAIRDCGTSARYGSPKSGARVVLDYLLNEGYVHKVTRYSDGKMSVYEPTKQLTDSYAKENN